jgi:zinc protease
LPHCFLPLRRGLAVIVILIALAAPAHAQRFGAESVTLENGLQVVVIPNHRVAAVTHMVWYRAGAADEQPGKTGLAHFLEHLMFKGTREVPPGMFSRIVAQNGGRDNAFTTQDYTAYYQNVAVDRLELVMKLEADRMQNLVLSDAVVLPERDVILEERHQRIDNEPSALLNEQLRTALFLNHPYRMPTIGWEHEMRQLTTEDAIGWYRTWYAPNNAIVVIAGDVTLDQVKPLAEKYYGAIASRPVPRRQSLEEPKRHAATRMELKSPRVAEPNWTRSYLAPSFTGGETRHAYPLQVLAEVMGGGATSRLYRSLVIERKIALSAGAFYNPGSRYLTNFGFYASPKPGVAVEEVEKAVEEEVRKLVAEGVTLDEAQRAITRMQAEAVYAQDSLSGPANLFGAALANGRTIDDVERWPERIGQVTVEQINEAARAVIDDKTGVTGLLLPQPSS